MCYNKEKEKMNMKKQIKQMIKKLKEQKSFLENKIKSSVNDLGFYDYFGYTNERQNTINYLDMTWEQYDLVVRKLKELKRDLRGSR
jgi:molybdate-binding protein